MDGAPERSNQMQRQKQKRIPCGNDKQRSKSKCRCGGFSTAPVGAAFGRDDAAVLRLRLRITLQDEWFGGWQFDMDASLFYAWRAMAWSTISPIIWV